MNSKAFPRKPISESSILLAGPVRNVATQIEGEVIQLISSLSEFKNIFCLVVESDSNDETLAKLEELSSNIPNLSFITAGQLSKLMPRRTDRIAHCRNLIIEAVRSDLKYANVDYIAMADMDGMNNLITRGKIAQCWTLNEPWDVITANQLGEYYDIWALSHPYWNPLDCWEQKQVLEGILGHDAAQNIAIQCKQGAIDPGANLIEVDSAFGGLAIYTRDAFLAGKYAGTDIENRGIDVADHIPFHKELRKKGYRIFVNPALINCSKYPVVEEEIIAKPRNGLQLIQKLGVLLFGKQRFNKYLEALKSS